MSDTRRAGFTLLELMLAMTALAMLAAICYGAFHLGVRALQSGEVAVVTAQRLRVASDVLIRQVKSIVPYAARNEDEEVYPYFFGTATSMTFITAAGLQSGGSLARVVYRLVDNPPALMLEESGLFSPDELGTESPDRPGDRSVKLIEGFRSLRFEYMPSDQFEEETLEWRSVWDAHEEESLPGAIRIVVDGMPGIESGVWGQEMPVVVASYSPGVTDDLEDGIQDATGGADEVPTSNRKGSARDQPSGEQAEDTGDGGDEGADDGGEE